MNLARPKESPIAHVQPKFTSTRITRLEVFAFAAMILAATVAQAQTYSVLYSFPGDESNGFFPASTLIRDSDGNLYGVTNGGPGVIFKLSSAGTFTRLYDFTSDSNGSTVPGLVRDKAGNLYGVAEFGGLLEPACASDQGSGCGTVFELDASGHFSILHLFEGGENGAIPVSLSIDAAGNLYGTTQDGGINCTNQQPSGCGVIFKIDVSRKFSVLHRFAGGSAGQYPNGSLTIDGAGNQYGTARGGINDGSEACVSGCGILFKIDTSGKMSTLYQFTRKADGAIPWGGLLLDARGNLNGSTLFGNTGCEEGCGTIFKFDTTAGKLTTLHDFTGPDGGEPNGGLVSDAAGNLYGTAILGGNTFGIVFKLDAAQHETVLYAFKNEADGGNPRAGLTIDPEANLYGTAATGGKNSGEPDCDEGCGVIFKIAAATNLNLSLVASPTPPQPGQLLTYTFKIWNRGPDPALKETLTTQVPDGAVFNSIAISGKPGVSSCSTPAVGATGAVVCNEGSLMQPGSTWTIRVSVEVRASAGTVLTETGTASSSTHDLNQADNTATVHNTVR
jgi:uncharacterized repeat protein (TIGR01451 family)